MTKGRVLADTDVTAVALNTDEGLIIGSLVGPYFRVWSEATLLRIVTTDTGGIVTVRGRAPYGDIGPIHVAANTTTWIGPLESYYFGQPDDRGGVYVDVEEATGTITAFHVECR
jgi:hypothetical protein